MNSLQEVINNNRLYLRIVAWILLAAVAIYVFIQITGALSEQSELTGSAQSVTADAESTSDAVAATPAPGSTSSTSTTKAAATRKSIGEVEVVISGSLNIRNSPGTSSSVIGSAAKGAKLTVLSKSNGWYQIVDSKGVEGYVASDGRYVKVLSMKE